MLISTRLITRLERRVGTVNSLHCSKAEVKIKLKESCKRYYCLKKQAGELRESWLLDLAALKAKASDGDQSIIYKNLIRQEKQKKAVKKEKNIR